MSEYTFRINATHEWIMIHNGEREEPYRVSTLRWMILADNEPDEVRAMARAALREFGLLQEKTAPDLLSDPSSETIATIQGVKVYQGLISKAFFILFGGGKVFGSLSELEKKIKGVK